MSRIANTDEAIATQVFQHISTTAYYGVGPVGEIQSNFFECDGCGDVWDAVVMKDQPDPARTAREGLQGEGWKLGSMDYCPNCAGCTI